MSKNEMFKVIDFEAYKLGCAEIPSDDQLKTIASDVVSGFIADGLLVLKNSGLDKKKDKKAWESLDKFLELSEDDKKKYTDITGGTPKPNIAVYAPPNIFGGYTGIPASNVEAFHFYSRAKSGSLSYPEEEAPGIVEHMTTLSEELLTLACRVLECLAIGEGQDRHAYDYAVESVKTKERFGENLTMIRFNYYRPIDIVNEEDLPSLRLGEHVDINVITIILLDSEGLQVQTRDGKWIDAPLIPDTCVVQVGTNLSFMTGIRAPLHRVVFTGGENDNKPRRSTAFGLFPDR